MNTITKSTFIKFNVSPQFKALAEKKAREHGMTVSELGRMLFGTFVAGMTKPKVEIDPEFIAMAEKAKTAYRGGKGILATTEEELEAYLTTL